MGSLVWFVVCAGCAGCVRFSICGPAATHSTPPICAYIRQIDRILYNTHTAHTPHTHTHCHIHSIGVVYLDIHTANADLTTKPIYFYFYFHKSENGFCAWE